MENKNEINWENYHKYKLVSDYFIFDKNDIDLHKIEKCFDLYLKEFDLTVEDLENNNLKFKDFLTMFGQNDLSKFSFPCLKNSTMGYLTALKLNNKNNHLNCYFFMLVLSNRNIFKDYVKNYYLGIIKNNYFGISPKFGYVITREIMMSDEYNLFTDSLSEWYAKIEIIIFYITILNQFFGIMLNFEEKKYSLENNFDFSLKTFAKKNFLKLASFIFKKSSLDIKLGEMNYNKIFLILISSFTCGISLKDIFLGGDLSQLALI
jgi:hypothetical protein